MVLQSWATKPDDKGRSQVWKIKAREDDLAQGKYDSTVLKEFLSEVESTFTALERVKPIVQNLCKQACSPKKSKVSVQPVEPAEPPTDPSVHGIDLGWD